MIEQVGKHKVDHLYPHKCGEPDIDAIDAQVQRTLGWYKNPNDYLRQFLPTTTFGCTCTVGCCPGIVLALLAEGHDPSIVPLLHC